MAKITGFRISQKNRLGMTDYNGADLETSVYVELEDGDEPTAEIARAVELVQKTQRTRSSPYLPFVTLRPVNSNGIPAPRVVELYQGRPVLKDDDKPGATLFDE